MTGLFVLLGSVVVAAFIAWGYLSYNGRFRNRSTNDVLTDIDLGSPLGEQATLLHFSSTLCAPCRTTRTLLEDVAGIVDGVTVIEIDVESSLRLARRLSVMRTPTVMVLDPRGVVVRRASGPPRRAEVFAALEVVAGRS